jgi:hypothetical protein
MRENDVRKWKISQEKCRKRAREKCASLINQLDKNILNAKISATYLSFSFFSSLFPGGLWNEENESDSSLRFLFPAFFFWGNFDDFPDRRISHGKNRSSVARSIPVP